MFRLGLRVICAGFLLVAISSCGGGGGGDVPSTPPSSQAPLSSVVASSLALSSSLSSSSLQFSSSIQSSSSSIFSSQASSVGSQASSAMASSTSSIATQARIDAATSTAQNNSLCTAIQPFYWELGDKTQTLVSGSEGGNTYQASTVMPIASASKWVFGAYVVQLRAGVLSASEISALTMRSGYTNFNELSCVRLSQVVQDAETVDECIQNTGIKNLVPGGTNGDFFPEDVNHFYYNGGHFQKLATTLGMGALNNAGLQTQMQSLLGSEFQFSFGIPQLAGGVHTSASNYAIFLRKILNSQLTIASMLGANSVCTNLVDCPPAAYTPIPAAERWNYSLGHWVESDPVVGDGAFSSPGAFGFYPWIDSDKNYYGVVARSNGFGSAIDSVYCGRLIRKAWLSGVAQ